MGEICITSQEASSFPVTALNLHFFLGSFQSFPSEIFTFSTKFSASQGMWDKDFEENDHSEMLRGCPRINCIIKEVYPQATIFLKLWAQVTASISPGNW